ncbi:ThiS family protein [uncultured archaeon]|nr:ThiS family protein [uncultured archaeon]
MNINLIENGVSKQLAYSIGDSVKSLLEKNKINSETCIVSVNGNLVHPTYTINENDKVEVIKIIYGG